MVREHTHGACMQVAHRATTHSMFTTNNVLGSLDVVEVSVVLPSSSPLVVQSSPSSPLTMAARTLTSSWPSMFLPRPWPPSPAHECQPVLATNKQAQRSYRGSQTHPNKSRWLCAQPEAGHPCPAAASSSLCADMHREYVSRKYKEGATLPCLLTCENFAFNASSITPSLTRSQSDRSGLSRLRPHLAAIPGFLARRISSS